MTVRVLESVVRRAGLAVRPVNLATGMPVTRCLQVTVWPDAAPAAKVTGAPPTGVGLIGFPSLPGLRPFEDGSTPRSDWFGNAAVHAPQAFTVRIVDPLGRFLRVVRSVLVPANRPVDIALPPAPPGPAPAGFGLVVGQVVRLDDDEPAAWALLRVTSGTTVAGGVSDHRGMFAVFVPLASPPAPGGAPSSPMTWPVSVSVRYRAADQVRGVGTDPDDPPTFESIVGQSPAQIDAGGDLVADIDRSLTRSGPLVAASSPAPPPSTLVVRPSP